MYETILKSILEFQEINADTSKSDEEVGISGIKTNEYIVKIPRNMFHKFI